MNEVCEAVGDSVPDAVDYLNVGEDGAPEDHVRRQPVRVGSEHEHYREIRE